MTNMTRGWRHGLSVLALAFAGCVPSGGGGGGNGGNGGEGGGGGGDGGPVADGGVVDMAPPPIESDAPDRIEDAPAETLGYGAAIDALAALAADPGFDAAQMGDPGAYVNSEATTPSDGTFASVYYESVDLAEALEGARDRRPGVEANDTAGLSIANRIATAIQIGAGSEGDGRGGPAWYANEAAYRLHALTLFDGWRALDERSAAGFDRFVGLLWAADGRPHGTGALLAAVDEQCGSDHLAQIGMGLAAVRDGFVASIEADGQLDPLDRLVIEEGDDPAYDAAIVEAIDQLEAGLGLAMLAALNEPFTADDQAAALALLDVLGADIAAASQQALDELGRNLDSQVPAEVELDRARQVLRGALPIGFCEE